MSDFPRSLIEFQQRFSDEGACAKYLFAARWPQGFVCPGCSASKAWELQTKPWTWECAACGRQTSVTAGTIMHHSKLPLTTWFWAAYLMATHSNGISALQLQRQLGLGSYRSAWLLCAKLRHSMVASGRTALAGLVEVDETEIPCRSKNDPVTGGGGRSHQGKMLIVGAVEVQDGGAGPGGARTDRAQLRRLLAALGPGDVLTVTRLDRLARSTRDLLNTLAAITEEKAGFRSVGDAWADTTTAHGRLMLTVLGGLAEFERELIRARTGEGRERARARGVTLGRKPKLTPHQKREAIRRRDELGETLADIARTYNVSRSTISRLTA